MVATNSNLNQNNDPATGTQQDAPMSSHAQDTIDQLPSEVVASKPPRPTPRTSKGVVGFFAAIALSGVGLAALGYVPRRDDAAQLDAAVNGVAEVRRTVTVATPTKVGAHALRLPGSTSPLQSTTLYARTNGYVKKLHADIGDVVKAGQVLAEIESPETDQQLNEAQATLERNRADLALVEFRLNRLKELYVSQAAGRGELDDVTAQYNAAVAAVRQGEAQVSRLATEQSYQKVIAPFSGKLTRRNVELGSLVTEGSNAGVTGLFQLEQTDVLKVFVDVPQSSAPSVTVGQPATVEVREYAGRTFEGKVVRTAGSLDPASRSLRVEVHVPNRDGVLLAGAYAYVTMNLNDPRTPVRIPAAALVVDSAGPQVVSVTGENALQRVGVTLGRDFGKEIEVVAGLTGAERLVMNPRDDQRDGERVVVR